MCTIMVISLIFILYLCIRWLYKEYKLRLIQNEFISLQDELRIGKLEREEKMNEQMINWLCDQVAKDKLKQQKKQNKKLKQEIKDKR